MSSILLAPQIPKWQKYQNSGKPLPAVFPNLRHWFGSIVPNQVALGACTSFATLQAFAAIRCMEGYPYQLFSPLAQFFESRLYFGEEYGLGDKYTQQNSGVSEDIALMVLLDKGVMPEQYDPWNSITQQNWVQVFKQEPPAKDWLSNIKLKYNQVYQIQETNSQQRLNDVLDALAQGLPVLLTAWVYNEIFHPASDGAVAMPAPSEQVVGLHEIVGISNDPVNKRVLFLNSWGPNWGNQLETDLNGCGYFSYDYLMQYLSEAFVLTPEVSVPTPQTYPEVTILLEQKSIVYKGSTMVPPSFWKQVSDVVTDNKDGTYTLNGKKYMGLLKDNIIYLDWTVMVNNGYQLKKPSPGTVEFTKP